MKRTYSGTGVTMMKSMTAVRMDAKWTRLSGSRVGEGIGLKWGSVDLTRGLVTIYQEKTKCAKVLPLSTEARRILKAQGRGLPDALVFPRPSGGPWEHAKLWRTFKAALRLSGGRGALRIHDTRHTAGSWLAQEGFSEAVISEVLGHSRAGVTAGYVHLRPEHLREAVEKLGELARADLSKLDARHPSEPDRGESSTLARRG